MHVRFANMQNKSRQTNSYQFLFTSVSVTDFKSSRTGRICSLPCLPQRTRKTLEYLATISNTLVSPAGDTVRKKNTRSQNKYLYNNSVAVENMTPAFYFFEEAYMLYIVAAHALHTKEFAIFFHHVKRIIVGMS